MNVLVAMSGGVDSSVAAALLVEAGHTVMGVTMRLLASGGGAGCCGALQDVEDARRVCARLGIPHYALDFASAFEKGVVAPFLDAYRRGRTPNPCVDCNRRIKFDALLRRALVLGAEAVATGHYARVVRDGGLYHLCRGVDPAKDQSYFLHHLTQAELANVLFPLGDLTKRRVRELARGLGLRTAEKKESMDLCFVPRGNTEGYVREAARRGADDASTLSPGPLRDRAGNVRGTHRGVAYYTRGQRSGLGALGRRFYVVDLDPATNTVVVGDEEETFSGACAVEDVVWGAASPGGPLRASVQIRSRHEAAPAWVQPTPGGAEVRFDRPQRALAPGQAAVFYDGERVLGGGAISVVRRPGGGEA